MLSQEWVQAIAGFLAFEKLAGKPATTRDCRRQHLEHLARRVPCGPWDLDRATLLDYASAQEWSQETRRGRRTTFVRFYAWAVTMEWATVNVAESLPKVPVAPARARPAPDRVYREALIRADARGRLMLRLAAEVGLRRAEVARVHTRDVLDDLVGHSIVVHGKGGRTRTLPLPQSLGRHLASLDAGWVFPGNDGGHLSPRYVGKLLAGLLPDTWTAHTLRHRFATRAYALRSDLLLVQELLGHASPVTTRRYVEYDRARMRAVVDELAG